MPTYAYKARDISGKAVKGTMEALSKEELFERLRKLGYLVTDAEKAELSFSLGRWLEGLQRIRSDDLIVFNVQLSNLIHAGVPLLYCLATLSQQVENKKLKEVIGEVSRNVEAGESFSEALAHYPKIFPRLFLGMVRAGELSGKLDAILASYAEYCEAQAELDQKISAALLYPAILVVAGIAVSFFIVTYIVPQFAQIFMKVGIPLPLPTLMLYQVATALKYFWHTLLLFVVLGWLGLQGYASTLKGRLQTDRWKLGLPVVGSLIRKVAIARFARTLGMLVGSGVPILQSLEIVTEVIGNEVLSRAVRNAHDAVEKGEKLSEPLRVSREFPPDTIQLIAIGEETGSLDEMLEKIADFYDRWAAYAVKRLTTIMEPVLLILMGGLVGFIMASMLLPMFDMMKVLRQARTGF